ncbi:MAG: pyridoxal phosphate-dependent aminotransferase [Actinobacteria bacterium]|nr:pyridoxal phosphate-dependent aminotransferase [Actinomycetota bacterium]
MSTVSNSATNTATSPVSKLVAAVLPSATLAVDAKAKALKAAGEPVIGFGAGEPDFPTPDHIVDAAVEACRNPANHRYSPAGGLPDLKEAIAVKTRRDSGYEVDASQVLVTNGGKHAVFNTFLALIDPGDEVLLLAPFWTTYPESIRLARGVPITLATTAASSFKVTVDDLEAARTEATKALLFVSPSNPTGSVYNRDEIEAIGNWAAKHRIWVITDEIYEHLVYDGTEHHSMPVVVPEIRDRCIVLNGVAKTYAMTGWRVGWMIAPPAITKAATNLQSHSTSNVANVSQRAALAAVAGPLDAVADMRLAFDRRRRTIHSMLNEIDGVECPEPKGAFYAFPSFEGLLGRELAGRTMTSTLDIADVILDEVKVAFVPGEAFGAPGYARFSFALGDDDLKEGISRIASFLAR